MSRSRQTKRLSLIASFIATLPLCVVGQDKPPDVTPAQQPAFPAAATPPASPGTHASSTPADLAPFARLIGGEWKMTAQSGTSMYDTWHWGPGRHSLREMTHGLAANGDPWRELCVLYWHPGRKQVCMLGVGPYERSVWEGTIKFEGKGGDAAEGITDLYQTGRGGGVRKMALRWTFQGPDKYNEALLESTGPKGFEPLAAWDHFRSRPAAPTPIQTPSTTNLAAPPQPSDFLKPLAPLLGHTAGWEAAGIPKLEWAPGPTLRSTLEWIPYADAIYVRALAPTREGEPTHMLDAYIYHHTGTGKLRCLALSNRGSVYEGDITVVDGGGGGGALEVDLKGYEGDRVVPYAVRFDFEKDGSPRQRIWSVKGTEQTLVLDLHHKKLEAK